MGMFAALSGVVGKTHQQVEDSFRRYVLLNGGGLEQSTIEGNYYNYCFIHQQGSNTTLYYSDHFFDWDDASSFISRDLNTPVFSFHIHAGKFWMYSLYAEGKLVDQFNPLPGFWDENISTQERDSWKGSAAVVSQYVPGLNPASIERYLIRWDVNSLTHDKAYKDDLYAKENWQLIDFMRKVGFVWPLGDSHPLGTAYKMWTQEHPFPDQPNPGRKVTLPTRPTRPWWKFW